ncbi:MAG: response regulator [Gammaproteobacteria bacterium]|nr:response regulator [Gammaproteobacteria bacterium]
MQRIMLVDDDENVLRAVKRVLAQDNYHIETFNSGTEALKRIKAGGEFDLAISDYRMPGMDGVFFLTTLHQLQPDTLRMVLSAYTDMDALLGAINEAHIFRFVTKPWHDYELRTTVAHALMHHGVLMENRRLADQVRAQRLELERLEAEHAGITRVKLDDDGSILLDAEDT